MHAITARRGLMAATSLAHGLSEDLSRSQHEYGQRLRRDPEHTWRRLRGKAIGIVRNAPERPPQATRSVDECDAPMRPPTLSPASHLENRHRRGHDRGQHQCASRDGAGVLPREVPPIGCVVSPAIELGQHCGEPDRNLFAERRHPGAFPVGRDYASHSFAHDMSSRRIESGRDVNSVASMLGGDPFHRNDGGLIVRHSLLAGVVRFGQRSQSAVTHVASNAPAQA
jgi:hypothetical protein